MLRASNGADYKDATATGTDKFRIAQEAFQAQCRAESMRICVANSLMPTIHSMKLLLSDEAQIAKRRNPELRSVQADKTDAQWKVAALLDELLLSRKREGQRDQRMDTS
ncbi:hypothetical protein DICSQDRAFT_175951 [Dichomitus squalens LYAD-421 SS1]|uniref:Uncharacterized protein n=1 Tax=Dichomitus squalens (strain LYAD-421) TaxID=732165 RepID=R7SI48_DICSQ|nr:uncharacterized protein DICSQDRAFT_175951 [Dichomitus squalens LYAD-421 SS1]EJF55410.1 hypothetical protein DICSQDRAFT_175951 [Dichomitus squalens LYAD-421 SS1]